MKVVTIRLILIFRKKAVLMENLNIIFFLSTLSLKDHFLNFNFQVVEKFQQEKKQIYLLVINQVKT